jgi:ubiquinol-cytochrome c reductase cytochrome b subunit
MSQTRSPGLVRWFARRLKLSESVTPLLNHPTPRNLGWWYVFGSATATLFVMQVLTGICLALVYTPSVDRVYETLEWITYKQKLGWFLRGMHFWGSSAMVVMVFVHMTRVFLTGAYKYPRELTWIVGSCLLFCTLIMAYTGETLRWDQDAYWALGIGISITGRIPWIGPYLVRLILGGPNIGPETLSRVFAVHVFILAGLLATLLAIHLYLVIVHGISTMPDPKRPENQKTYDEFYKTQLKNGEPFYPSSMMKDIVFSSCIVVGLLVGALLIGPKLLAPPADPSIIPAAPRPDWPFLFMFSLYALTPRWFQDFTLIILPATFFVVLIIIPLVDNSGQRSPRRRPVAIVFVATAIAAFLMLTWLGYHAPWAPHMWAWTKEPVPRNLVKGLSPEQLQGAAAFQYKNCRNCHALEGQGGQRGPDLTNVATRLTAYEMVRQIAQGLGLMPAYGKQVSPPEVDALVAFLRTLHPKNETPASAPFGPHEKPYTGRGPSDRP